MLKRDFLRDLMTQSGMTVSALADAVGVSRQTVYRWEDPTYPHPPSLPQARVLADLAGCSIEKVAQVFTP